MSGDYILGTDAASDLDNIWEYIARDNLGFFAYPREKGHFKI